MSRIYIVFYSTNAQILSPCSETAVEPLDPPAGAVPGDRVICENYSDGQPDEELKDKQKVWPTLQPDFVTTDQKVAAWKGNHLVVVDKGNVTVKSLAKASIK